MLHRDAVLKDTEKKEQQMGNPVATQTGSDAGPHCSKEAHSQHHDSSYCSHRLQLQLSNPSMLVHSPDVAVPVAAGRATGTAMMSVSQATLN